VLLVSCAGSASGGTSRTLDGYGLSLILPAGWHGLAAAGQLQAADFPLPHKALGSPELARVPRGHVHLIVWDYGPSVPYLAGNFRRVRDLLMLRRSDLTPAPLEGFPAGDTYAIRTVLLGEEQIELVADFGPRPFALNRLNELNRLVRTLRVRPPRVIRPRHGRLGWDGVSLRLLRGWSGRIELPANQRAAQLVLRAHRGSVQLVLLQLPGAEGQHLDLPIKLSARDLIHQRGAAIARRVFSTAGRSIDLSVTASSAADLAAANRLLRTLILAPRPWTFRSCDLTLRLPGTWRAAVNPRSGCYPVITLHAPHLRVVLTELRPGEMPHGRLLRQSGRRFRVELTPPSALHEANAVLATLKVRRRP
jgi:hypothetical protein